MEIDTHNYSRPQVLRNSPLTRLIAVLSLGLLALAVAALAAPYSAQADGDMPTVTNIAVTSSPASGDTYGAGETIEVTATFSESVTVAGVPVLQINVGGSYQKAGYASGSGSTALVFQYTVAARDRDANGISIRQNSIEKPSADVTIQSAGGTDANTDHPGLPNQKSHKVEGFGVTKVAITSNPASGDTYGADETIQVTATFSEAVTVTGVPFLRMTVGSVIRHADYASGSGSTDIVFEYDVMSRDKDTDGVSIPQNPIVKADATGAAVTIKGVDSTDANPNHPAVPAQPSHKVDGSAMPAAAPGGGPHVTAIAITSSPKSGDTYSKDEKIKITVSWSAGVYVAGAEPSLNLTIGDSTVQAEFVHLDADDESSPEYKADASYFSYTVAAGDLDTNGVSIPPDPIDLPSGSVIRGISGNIDAVRTYSGLADQTGHKVNAAGGM